MAATTLTDRAVIRLSGEDVREFLQGLVTSDVTGALPVWAGLLTPQGKCLFDFIVWSDGDDLLLDCEAAAADDLDQAPVDLSAAARDRDRARPSLAVHWSADGGRNVPIRGLPELGTSVAWLRRTSPAEQAGSSIAFVSASARAARSSAISSGSSATPPS